MLRTITDPRAMEILTRIALGPATSAEVAEALGLDPKVVRGQLRRLCTDGQVVRQGTVRRRQRPENLYAADLRANVLDAADLAGVPRRLVDEADLALLRVMFREAAAALEAGVFTKRPEFCSGRAPIPMDEQALRQAGSVHRRLLFAIVDEVERSRGRLDENGAEPILASAHILFFMYPHERWAGAPARIGSPRRRPGGDRVQRSLENTDPLRIRICEMLAATPATVGDLADRLEVPAQKVRYEVEGLLADELLRVVGRRPSRGTTERIFVTDLRAQMLTSADYADQRGGAAGVLCDRIVRDVFRDALQAIGAEARTAEDDLMTARVPLGVDAEGFAAISALMEAAMQELFTLWEHSLDRSGEDEVSTTRLALSAFLLFDRAPPRHTTLPHLE